MDELEISGKRYISTRRAAKEHKYHSDYIGQLIRGGKVVGQKVGRSWYVEAASLATYLGKESTSVEPASNSDTLSVSEQVSQPRAALSSFEEESRAPQEKIVEEIAVTSDSEEEKIPIHIEQEEKFEPMIVKHEDVQIFPVRNAFTTPKKKLTLTYITDESPLLPQVQKLKRREVADIQAEVAEPAEVVSEEGESDEETPVKENYFLRFSFVACIGLLALAFSAGLSYMLIYSTVVEGNQMSASVSFSKLSQ